MLSRALRDGTEAVAAELAAGDEVVPVLRDDRVRARIQVLRPEDRVRSDYHQRAAAQQDRLGLPRLATTTIGSFPQTADIRRARAGLRTAELDAGQYETAMRAEIERVIRLQEEIGLDVLVHGEPERNDMVQYFAENLDGFRPPTTAGCSRTDPAVSARRSCMVTCPGPRRSRSAGASTRSR